MLLTAGIGSGATRRGTLPLPRKSVLQRVRPIVSPGGVKANRRDQGTFLSALRKWPGGYHDGLPSGKEADWQFARYQRLIVHRRC